MRTDYRYIVLGLGGIGSGAAYWLSRQVGSDVLGLEQFEIGHERGGSQDHSRIIRLSYHHLDYVAFAKGAYRAWADLEADAGEQLIIKTGGLDLSPPGAAIALSDYTESLRISGVPFEELDAAEIMRRWPQFRLDEGVRGSYQAESGIAPAARCNAAHIRMAREHGAILLDKTPICDIRPLNGEIEVGTADARYRCQGLVITGGAWTNQALGYLGMHLPLRVTQEQVIYFASPRLDDFMPERFPIWIWQDDPCFYGFPVYGEAGVKVAQDLGGREVTAETRSFEPDPDNFRRVEEFVKRIIPDAHGPVILTKTCLYTLPPDRDFIIDALPDHPNIALAVGAGHAFKFASVIGQTLADLVMGQQPAYNIERFRVGRPTLLN